ncbi:MAG TPA: CGNR zinc finger domain-containing protein [Geminicoccus sp.]|uniref:CGNR zinc finger domain-containing protein n=1 Tax=Geminicoccus sp. TaxID=2024832 RepID=UPI002E314538|nr:CGNR zinc finger domain-containing protein [Geminicoccus sp.]HEX2529163.1 CGNR zinc finger domain-containing protein [Geminicoccus sp.]
MTGSFAGSLSLVGGVLALDFANTAGGRNLPKPIEHLRQAGDLLDWAMHASVLPDEAAAPVRAALQADRALADHLLESALRLREAVHRIGAAIAHGRTLPPADLDTLRQSACASLAQAELAPSDDGHCALCFAAGPPQSSLLGPVAWSAMDLFQRGDLTRLKQCPAEDCGWLFIDTSRNGSRRWCDMSTCGNRTKVRRHRRAG